MSGGKYDLNPFTGDFEVVDDCNSGGGGPANGSSIPFVIGDWVLSAGLYYLDLQHNLESERVIIELFDDSKDKLDVHRTTILNTNTVRIYTTYDPDCRFNGTANIIAV